MSLLTWLIRWTWTLREPVEADMVERVDIEDKVDDVDLMVNDEHINIDHQVHGE